VPTPGAIYESPVWVAMLRNMQIAHAWVCWLCAQRARLIPGLDPLQPPMQPDTPAPARLSHWLWLWLSGDLFRTREDGG
jgi:hypothetical protein